MGGFTIKIEGLEDVQAKLTELGGETAQKVIRKGLRAGGRVFAAAVTAAAPMRPDLPSGTALPPGALKEDIILRMGQDDGLPAAIVSPGRATQHIARYVEYGHRLVKRSPKGNIKLKVRGGGKGVLVGNVPAYPFIRPAFEGACAEAMAAAGQAIAQGIEDAAKGSGGSGDTAPAAMIVGPSSGSMTGG